MQITNQLTSSRQLADKQVQLNKGEIYQATIKNRKANNEAVLLIRGQEMPVKFEGTVPSGDRATIVVGEQTDGLVQVKQITGEGTKQAFSSNEAKNAATVLTSLGITNSSKEITQAVQLLLDKDVPLTKEVVRDLQLFFDAAKGATDLKLQSIQALANKRLYVTSSHLHAVHEALHGRPMNEVLTNLAKEIAPDFEYRTARESAYRGQHQIQSASLDNWLNDIRIQFSSHPSIERVLSEAMQLQQTTKERFHNEPAKLLQMEMIAKERVLDALNLGAEKDKGHKGLPSQIEASRTILQREANIHNIIQHLQETILVNEEMNDAMKDKLANSLHIAKELTEKGREIGARQELSNTLLQLTNEVNREQSNIEPNSFNASKVIAETTVTQKMAELTVQFKDIQRDLTRNLDVVSRLIDLYRGKAVPQAKPLLETTINKLDQLILKSEMMLLTDMKTEKQLMQASSQLAEAKKLLSKGNFQEASRIVQEVKSQVERVQFQPSETKIKHYTDAKMTIEQASPKQQVVEMMRQIHLPLTEPSARQAFEMVRQLGLNRDIELAQAFSSNRDSSSQRDSQQNLKNALLQLVKEDENNRLTQQANQALNNITGQQLLSKADINTHLQSMFFNLPFLLQEKAENLQVFVNSRKEGEKVDWENCSLYFLIETPKLGEVGISLNVADRNLAVTIKNDKEDFKIKMEPLLEKYVNTLTEIGYSISGVQFSKMKVETDEKVIANDNPHKEEQQPIYSEKGFDFKI